MRSEEEMFELILGFARQDERVRAVLLDGSRADPQAHKDLWQDFDIVYVVTDVNVFKTDPDWIDVFGERMILQLPDDMGESAKKARTSYCYLMQFMDGTRIDLTLYPVDKLDAFEINSYCYPLLDKDGCLHEGPFRDPATYYPKPPTAKEYADCCNEFWWCCPYVAKGVWRNEIVYAHHMLDEVVRGELVKMLTWYIGTKTNFLENPGKFGRRFQKLLPTEIWISLMETYASADPESIWNSLLKCCEIFRLIAREVAEKFSFAYPTKEDERVFNFLQQIRSTPNGTDDVSASGSSAP
jgi:aminoglycoside 6-adenylyltransferase